MLDELALVLGLEFVDVHVGVGILVVGTVRAATARDGDGARRSDPAADGTTAGRVSDGGSQRQSTG